MDLQYVPALLTPAKRDPANKMVDAIGEEATEPRVNVFRRFALMKGWHEVELISFDRMVDASDVDRLHDSDWATQRLTRALFCRCDNLSANDQVRRHREAEFK
jgi:hypothetical protein